MILKSLPDEELLKLIKEENVPAFDLIYERYFPLLYIYGCKIISNEEEVKDVLQEVFLYLWSKDIDLKGSFSSYIYSAVRYKLFDHIDKQKVRENYTTSFQIFIDTHESLADDLVLEKELAYQIEKEIRNLPKRMQEVFVLSREGNKSYREIASHLDISDKTVKKQVSNALKILRSKLSYLLLLATSLSI